MSALPITPTTAAELQLQDIEDAYIDYAWKAMRSSTSKAEDAALQRLHHAIFPNGMPADAMARAVGGGMVREGLVPPRAAVLTPTTAGATP